MEGGKMSSFLQNDRFPPSEVLDSYWLPNSNPSFQASASMVNFNDSRREIEHSNEDYTGCFHQPEKKRRLSPEQVHFLEKSFESENKLEPERKVQLAKELGLQPRQVAVWFQNRRARCKTKHIEKEYDSLKSSYDKLKADYDSLSKENEKLRNEVHLLTEKLMSKEKGNKAKPEPPNPPQEQLVPSRNSQNGISSPMAMCKQEDAASSAKSDVFDSDSPRYTDGIHSSFLGHTDSQNSDFSQDEDDNTLLRSPCLFPKHEHEEEEEDHCLQMPPYSCSGLGFSIEDNQTTPWFWSY